MEVGIHTTIEIDSNVVFSIRSGERNIVVCFYIWPLCHSSRWSPPHPQFITNSLRQSLFAFTSQFTSLPPSSSPSRCDISSEASARRPASLETASPLHLLFVKNSGALGNSVRVHN